MKYMKMLGLAAVAALALMAVVGAGTASAAAVVCSTTGETANATCTTAGSKQVKNGQAIDATLKPGTVAELTSTFDNVKCSTSTVAGQVTNGGTGAGDIESMTFSSCTDSFGGTCTADTSASSANKWPATTTAHQNNAETGEKHDGNGTMTVTNITGKFSCPIGTCRYTASSATTTVTGGEPATVTATKVSLNREEVSSFGCSATATWSGTYTVTTPNSLWLY
jgi:hypothetical protein